MTATKEEVKRYLAELQARAPGRAVEVSRGNSWERIVGEMELLVARIIQQRYAERRTEQQSWSRLPGSPSSRRPAAAGA